jgi:hypothetical protein
VAPDYLTQPVDKWAKNWKPIPTASLTLNPFLNKPSQSVAELADKWTQRILHYPTFFCEYKHEIHYCINNTYPLLALFAGLGLEHRSSWANILDDTGHVSPNFDAHVLARSSVYDDLGRHVWFVRLYFL